jgi:hypothetical protein
MSTLGTQSAVTPLLSFVDQPENRRFMSSCSWRTLKSGSYLTNDIALPPKISH